MIYGFVTPGLLAFLALNQRWFHDIRGWVDAKYNQDTLLRGDALTAGGLAHLTVTTAIWVIVPLTVAIVRLIRSEVK